MSEQELVPYDGPSGLVLLHNHTVFSTLDGVATPEQYFSLCKEREWPAIAITEHGTMSSVPDNYFASKANGVKAIIGCEIYFNDYEPLRVQLGTQAKVKEQPEPLQERIRRNRHLTVLAKNATGVSNLIKLTTQAYETGFYYKPRIWYDKLLEYKEGLIILSGCLNGPVSHEIHKKRIKNDDGIGPGALDYVKKFKDDFGDDYYIELQMPCLPPEDGNTTSWDLPVFWTLNAIAKKFGIKTILANDSHYITRRDYAIQTVMMAIDQGVTVNSPDLFHVNSDEQYFKTRHELWHTFKTKGYCKNVSDADFHAMCDNTIYLAEGCDPYKPDTSPKVPNLPDAANELKRKVVKALIEKGLHKDKTVFIIDNKKVTYVDQVKIELDRFIEKGFASYFLVTEDLIKFSIDQSWPVGPRGSVGGSLVCYLLGITSQDPCIWGLSFSRFLSPSRGGYMLNIKAE